MPSTTPGRYAPLLYDEIFKLVFSAPENEDLLIMLLNLLIPEIDVKEITFIDKEQHGFAFNEKKCIFDVYCRTEAGETVIIEMQFKREDDFLDRALFYATYPIREQILSGSRRFLEWIRQWMRRKKMEAKVHPYRLKPVYVVSILNFSLQHSSDTVLEDGLVCRYELRERSSGELMTDALHFVFLELGRMKYGAEHPERCGSVLEKLAFSLKYIDQLQGRPGEMLEEIFKRLFDAAELAAMDAQTRRIVDKTMTTKIDTLQHLHNTYIDGHLDGEKVGLEKGLAKGLEKGLEKGRAEAFKRVEDQLRRDGMPEEEIKRILDGARK
jgi:predicted transposase/invertase (TIGR01784 family)